jgi:hypothetical protein
MIATSEVIMRTLRLGAWFTSFAIVAGSVQAGATVLEVEFTATDFVGIRERFELTGEPPPDEEVNGSFTIDAPPPPAPLSYEVVPPSAIDLTIAGRTYDPATTDGLVLLREDGTPWEAVLGSARLAPDDTIFGGPPTVDNFVFRLVWDEAGNLMQPFPVHPSVVKSTEYGHAAFVYGTPTSLGGFFAFTASITASIDGGTPQTVAVADAVPDASVCWEAYLAGDPLRGETQVGDYFCDDPPEECMGAGCEDEGEGEGELGAAEGTSSRRDVKLPRSARRAGAANVGRVKTVLGTYTVVSKRVDRLSLAANAGASSAVEPPADETALECSKAKIKRGTTRFRPVKNVKVGGARYHLGAPIRHCVDPTGAGADQLCYRARPAVKEKSAKSDLWVAHALATEHLSVGRTKEVCLPVTNVE